MAEIHFRDCNQSASSNSSPDNKTSTFLFLASLVTPDPETRSIGGGKYFAISVNNVSRLELSKERDEMCWTRVPRNNARHWHRENHIRTQSSSSSLIDKLIFVRADEGEVEGSNIFLLFHFPASTFADELDSLRRFTNSSLTRLQGRRGGRFASRR